MALTKGGISGDSMIVMIIVYTDEEAYNMYMPWTTTYKSNAHYKGSDQFVFLNVFLFVFETRGETFYRLFAFWIY